MKVKISRMYAGKDVPKNIKVKYDKTSKRRPAWIWIGGLPQNIVHLSVRINGIIIFYRIYISSTIPLFLPSNYTKEEMRKFYDKFSEIYDNKLESINIPAAGFLLKNIKLPKDAKILDLGAGTGFSSIPFIKKGYKNIILLDYSKGMLAKARKRKELKKCRFIRQNIMKLDLKEKFDLIISIFSFASNSYFDEKDMQILWRKLAKHLRSNGILALLGYDYEPKKTLFNKIKSGKKEIIEGYHAKWFIGQKK